MTVFTGLVFAIISMLLATSVNATWRPHFGPPRPPRPHLTPRDYALTHNYVPSNLLQHFEFRTAADYPGTGDPTNGFVNYVDEDTAWKQGLVKRIHNKLFLGVDNETILDLSVQGRNSIRLESTRTFDSGLLIADFSHMPGNQCGVWPAFWIYNMDDDPVGEVDIIEGINHQSDNIVSVHTSNKCNFFPGWQTGKDQRPKCALFDLKTNQSNWDGCGMTATRPFSYGTSFNRVHGGVYATLLEDQAIKIWHWPRHAIPRDIKQGRPRPWTWGKPMGDMSKWHGGCDIKKNFHKQTIIINTDFCGDNEPQETWEGDPKCAKYTNCTEFIAKHPEEFHETYWLINYIKVYERRRKPWGHHW